MNTLFGGLLMHPQIAEVDFSGLRVAIGGGAAVLPTTSAKWKALTGRDILEGYGLSETSPILTLNPMTTAGFSATVGLPFPSTDIKLLDAERQGSGARRAGRNLRQGPASDAAATGKSPRPTPPRSRPTAISAPATSACSTTMGSCKIVDRKKDMIIVSGFNVYPNEVEAVAAACAGVAECACVGRPDEKTGEAVRLFVAKAPGATMSEADVIAHCRRELAAYKVPKEVRFLDALPKSNVGKILRKDLRAHCLEPRASTMAIPQYSMTTAPAVRRPRAGRLGLGHGRPGPYRSASQPALAIGSGSTSTSSAPSAKARSAGRSRTATSPYRWSPRW